MSVEGETVAEIGQGLLVLIGIERDDTPADAERMAERLTNYRVFADSDGRMNLNVQQIDGAILLVPQFTLAADTSQGNRPGFSRAADPATGAALFDAVVAATRQRVEKLGCGRFGADMAVAPCERRACHLQPARAGEPLTAQPLCEAGSGKR